MFGVILLRAEAIERDDLVADHAGAADRRPTNRVHASSFNLARVRRKLSGQMQHMKSCEIDVAPIHNVDRSRLQEQEIERVHVVQLAVGDVDDARNAAAQMEQCVHLHGGPGTAPNLTRTLLIRREY
jgi:hypothetical protein